MAKHYNLKYKIPKSYYDPIPGFNDIHLLRADNTSDNLGIFRAIELSRLKHDPLIPNAVQMQAKHWRARHLHMGIEFLISIADIDRHKHSYGIEDLDVIQNHFNNVYGFEKYNILVFEIPRIKRSTQTNGCKLDYKPLYEGNPGGQIPIPILRYVTVDGKTEFCGIKDVAKAFGKNYYCFKCKSIVNKHPRKHICGPMENEKIDEKPIFNKNSDEVPQENNQNNISNEHRMQYSDNKTEVIIIEESKEQNGTKKLKNENTVDVPTSSQSNKFYSLPNNLKRKNSIDETIDSVLEKNQKTSDNKQQKIFCNFCSYCGNRNYFM